jgi:hypothetical protein
MPQLDNLSYLSQFAYLFISFLGTYSFMVFFLIPRAITTKKFKQKLNSIALLTSKFSEKTPNFKLMHIYQLLFAHNVKFYGIFKIQNSILMSRRITQLFHMLKDKKCFMQKVL